MNGSKRLRARRGAVFLYAANRHIDAVRILAADHEIKPTEQLCDELEAAIRNYHHRKARDDARAPASEQRALFRVLRKRATSLRGCLSKLSTDEQAQLGGNDLIELDDHLMRLEYRVDGALSCLDGKESQRGRKSHDAFHDFVKDVRKSYVAATGCTDKYTYKADSDEYTGPFFSFVKALWPCIGIDKKDATLATDIREALKTEND